MCLKSISKPERRKEFIKKIGKEGLKVYKIVGVTNGEYHPVIMHIMAAYKTGVNEADTTTSIPINGYCESERYQAGYHFWLERKSAQKYLDDLYRLIKNDRLKKGVFRGPYELIECIVKKSWITAMGEDETDTWDREESLVSKNAIFPDPKEKNDVPE